MYSPFHWLIVVALLGYVWLLVKLAKAQALSNPIAPIQRSRLMIKTVAAWLCTAVFGLWTLGMVATSTTRPSAAPGDVSGHITDLVLDLGAPLLFALSIRWTRSLMRVWKASKVAQP
jgi:hypothetical protein